MRAMALSAEAFLFEPETPVVLAAPATKELAKPPILAIEDEKKFAGRSWSCASRRGEKVETATRRNAQGR